MKFFEKQKVDLIGTTSVSLQKILIFLMLLSAFTLFNGGLISFLLCLIGFIGAYKRHPGLLRAYVSISVALMVIAFVFALVATFSVVGDTDYEYYASSSSYETSSDSTRVSKLTIAKNFIHKLTSYGTGSNTTDSSSSVSSSTDPTFSQSASSTYTSSEYYEDDYTVFIFIACVVMVFAFFIVYIKIYSLVLAHRLRKLILTANTLPTTNQESQLHEFAPANTSCAVPENETPAAPAVPVSPVMPFQQFTPGFTPYPYPMMPMMPPNMAGQQFPQHQVMFGQQPIFYSYAPVPHTQAPSDEKL